MSLALKFAAYHKNTKGEQLSIPVGGYLEELYLEAWDQPFVIMKSTQCHISEFLLISMYAMAYAGLAHFYVLPTVALRNRFVDVRINENWKNSPFYQRIGRTTDNKGLKIFKGTAMAFVGSQAPGEFTEFAADVATIDELDRCDQNNLKMIDERLADSQFQIVRKVSQPIHEETGIDLEYAKSDKRKFFVKCASNHSQSLEFHSNLADEEGTVFDRKRKDAPRIVCSKSRCNSMVEREPGIWVPEGSGIRGYHISKLFSARVTPPQLVDRYRNALLDDAAMQRFWNGDMGIPYTIRGAKITRDILLAAIRDHRAVKRSPGPNVIGIDVGKRIHYVVFAPLDPLDGQQRVRLIAAGYVHDEKGVIELFNLFGAKIGVIDAMPEIQLVKNLQDAIPGLFRCNYLTGAAAQTEIARDAPKHNQFKQRLIQMNRTVALDLVKTLLAKGAMELPRGADKIEDLFAHLQAGVRVYDEEKRQYFWREGSKADHFHHCCAYGLMAMSARIYVNLIS